MIDELDELILKELRKDCRMSYRKIAEKLKVATGTVQNRIQKMEREKVINGYHADLDYSKLGYNISAIVAMCLSRDELKEIEEKLGKNPNVFGIFEVTGEFDIFISVRFKKMEELNKFIREELKHPGITKTVTFVVLNTKKEAHTFIE
ncbi:MAG: Lrp/AsnC family transcriptional regulator [archaeon]